MGAIGSQITSLTITQPFIQTQIKENVPGEFPAQMASNAENVSIWWRHHALWRKSAFPARMINSEELIPPPPP